MNRETSSPFSAEQAAEKPIEYAFLQDPEQRKLLAERVADLVKKTHEQGTTAMVFLDKSARPVAHLFNELWKGMYPTEPRPAIRFLNIGKEYVSKVKDEFTITEADEQTGVAEAKKQRIITCLERVREQYKIYEEQEAQADGFDEELEMAGKKNGCRETFFDILRQSSSDRNSDKIFNADLNSINTAVFKGRFTRSSVGSDAINAMDDTSIRNVFGEKPFEEIAAATQFLPKVEPGKQKITVVDEYSKTGGSRALAGRFVEAAFGAEAGEVSTTAIASKEDELFVGPTGETGEVPWRKGMNEYGQGDTGVIDNEGSIFAKPYYALDKQIHERNIGLGGEALVKDREHFTKQQAKFMEQTIESEGKLRVHITQLLLELPDLSPAVKAELSLLANNYHQCLEQDPKLTQPDTFGKLRAITMRPKEILMPTLVELAPAQNKNEQKRLLRMVEVIGYILPETNLVANEQIQLEAREKLLSSRSTSQAAGVRQLRNELSAVAKDYLAGLAPSQQ